MTKTKKISKGFRVGLKERKVILVATQDGEQYRLIHILKQPASSDWIEFERAKASISVKRGVAKVEGTLLEAKAALYDKLIISVEGYYGEKGQNPINCDVIGWKEFIPIIHKTEVIDTFGMVSHEVNNSGDLEKN